MDAAISREELQLAARNHGMPLEALRYPITPTGLHYLLIHYDIPDVDAERWTLSVVGRVRRPLSLSLRDLRERPSDEVTATMECAGNGRALLEPHVVSQPWLVEAVGTATWQGVPLSHVLDEAEPLDDAVDVVFTGLDHGIEKGVEQHYERALPLDAAREGLLAHAMNGEPLLPQHGFPLRLLVPGWYGMTNVKWLSRITVTTKPFAGYQQQHSYRLRRSEGDEGVPVDRMLPRALMVPPGIPDFNTRERTVRDRSLVLEGKAWSGRGPVTRVEASADGGATWADADVEQATSSWAWQRWTYEWTPSPGRRVLCCRATDAEGHVQPVEPEWNVGGYSNNAVQRVIVNVIPGDVDAPG